MANENAQEAEAHEPTPLGVILGHDPDYRIWHDADALTLFDAVCFLLRIAPDKDAYDKGRWSPNTKQRFDTVYSQALGSIHAETLEAKCVGDDYWVSPRLFVWWAQEKGHPLPQEMERHKRWDEHIGNVGSWTKPLPLTADQLEAWARKSSWTYGEAIYVMAGNGNAPEKQWPE